MIDIRPGGAALGMDVAEFPFRTFTAHELGSCGPHGCSIWCCGRAIITELWRHAENSDFTWTQVWAPGDLVAWDNRCQCMDAMPSTPPRCG